MSDFGHDPWWLVIAKSLAIFIFLVLTPVVAIYAERKIMARMQMRVGPNRVGPFGTLQSIVDGIKLALKEGIIPSGVDRGVYLLAPVIATVPAIMAFAVIPFGPVVSIAGTRTPLQLTDLPVAVLYILAVTSVGVYGIVLAGWASGSTYPLLGGLRSTAQVISYEIAMALCFAAVFLLAGTMSTSGIVAGQARIWYVCLLLPSFLIYVTAMVGETNRAPFDLPEAEGELVGGFHTEYSSLRFAMFMLAEYINMTTVSALATTLFLGGWRGPLGGWFALLWFVVKVWLLLFCFIWLRSTLPRMRYDQFMNLGWKVLIPVSLLWVMVVGTLRTLHERGWPLGDPALAAAGVVVAAGLLYGLLRAGNPLAGFAVTFGTMFKRPHTEFYPEQKRPTAPRYHGRHQLNRHPDGLEKCVGCELCAWACPADAIYVEGADNTETQRFSPGERYGRIYQINYLRCIGCGLCVEACPTRALTMTNEYELADDNRGALIFDKDQLLAPLRAGMLAPPHPMAPGATEADYYRGEARAHAYLNR